MYNFFIFAHERLCLGWTHESGRDDIGMRKKRSCGASERVNDTITRVTIVLRCFFPLSKQRTRERYLLSVAACVKVQETKRMVKLKTRETEMKKKHIRDNFLLSFNFAVFDSLSERTISSLFCFSNNFGLGPVVMVNCV